MKLQTAREAEMDRIKSIEKETSKPPYDHLILLDNTEDCANPTRE